jgi:hypothetical protein
MGVLSWMIGMLVRHTRGQNIRAAVPVAAMAAIGLHGARRPNGGAAGTT